MGEKQPLKTVTDLWEDAYRSLKSEKNGAKLLDSLTERLGEQRSVLKRDVGNLESNEGREALEAFIHHKSKKLKSSDGRILQLGEKAKGLISAGASASPPATIAVAGLFMAWDVSEHPSTC
jgi:hypothetical protein